MCAFTHTKGTPCTLSGSQLCIEGWKLTGSRQELAGGNSRCHPNGLPWNFSPGSLKSLKSFVLSREHLQRDGLDFCLFAVLGRTNLRSASHCNWPPVPLLLPLSNCSADWMMGQEICAFRSWKRWIALGRLLSVLCARNVVFAVLSVFAPLVMSECMCSTWKSWEDLYDLELPRRYEAMQNFPHGMTTLSIQVEHFVV